MVVSSILSYGWYGATKLYNVFGSFTGWWVPATMAAYKFDFTSVMIILLLCILFGWILYVLVYLCQMASNRFQGAVGIFSQNNNYPIVILGTLIIFVPIIYFVAYLDFYLLQVILYIALYSIGGHELVRRFIR